MKRKQLKALRDLVKLCKPSAQEQARIREQFAAEKIIPHGRIGGKNCPCCGKKARKA